MSVDDYARLALRVALAQSGDRDALDRLLREFQKPLYRHVRSILGNSDFAYDVLQDVLLLIARRLSGLRDPRWFRAWAFRIATREALRKAKRQSRDCALLDDVARVDPQPAVAAEPDYHPALVRACVDQLDLLPPAARLVLRLHYLEELTLVEISEALELPLGTIKSRLAYGLARLRLDLTE